MTKNVLCLDPDGYYMGAINGKTSSTELCALNLCILSYLSYFQFLKIFYLFVREIAQAGGAAGRRRSRLPAEQGA